MTTKDILLFGSNSQIGKAMARLPLPADWRLRALNRVQCDFTRVSDIRRAFQDVSPALVINAAAMTDVDACEKDHDMAITVNFDAVATIAAHCVERDAPLIHISTDYVFDGSEGKPCLPEDQMNPLNAYGESKMMAEEGLRDILHWHTIVRTSLVFGPDNENVLVKTLRQIDTMEALSAVSDQTANPTGAASLAAALIVMAERILSGTSGCFGTFHFCDAPALTRYEFLQAVMAAYAPHTGKRPMLTGKTAAEIPNRVPRPAFTPLNMDKTTASFGIHQRDWHDELNSAIAACVGARTA